MDRFDGVIESISDCSDLIHRVENVPRGGRREESGFSFSREQGWHTPTTLDELTKRALNSLYQSMSDLSQLRHIVPNPLAGAPLDLLLVEDSPGDARLFKEYLRESPVETSFRREPTLEAGLEALEKNRPDVLVLDLGLPDSEGTETVETAIEAAPEVPVIVLTGQDDFDVALRVQEAGAAEYLQKETLNPPLLGRTLQWALQRQQMQRKLRRRDVWVRSITEGLSAGVFRTGPTGRVEYANEALLSLLGVDREEDLLGLDLTEFVAGGDSRDDLLQEVQAGKIEVEFERQDGGAFVGLVSAESTYDEEGELAYHDGTITDITDRKEKEWRLRVLSEAVEQAKEAVLITEAEPLEEPGPRIEYVNRAYEEMTGYSEEEAVGKTPRILQGPETDRDVLDSLREALERGKEWEGEAINYNKQGKPYRVEWNVSPVRGENGEIEHWVSVQRDVTEERERESRLRGLANSIPGVVFQFVGQNSGVHEFTFVGEQAEDLLGLSPEPETFLDRVLARVPSSQREEVLRSIREAVQRVEPWHQEFLFETSAGKRIWVLGTATPERRSGDIAFNGVLLDITERKRREEDLIEARQEAEQAARLKSAMMANMSHEIRTPLTSIIGFSEMMVEELEGKTNTFAERVRTSAERLMETLNSILELSKLEAGAHTLQFKSFDLAELIEEVVQLARPEAEKQTIQLRLETTGAPLEGRWDRTALRRAVENLLSNAIKFTPEDGTVTVRVRPIKKGAEIEVEDTGIGMDSEQVESLFEAFKQASEGLDREYEGSGLGLSIVRQLIEAHGGSIEVETEKGEGSRFTLLVLEGRALKEGAEPPRRSTSDADSKGASQPTLRKHGDLGGLEEAEGPSRRKIRPSRTLIRRNPPIRLVRRARSNSKVGELIEIGRRALELPYGYLTRIEEGVQQIILAAGNHPLIQPGKQCVLSESYCRKTVQQRGVLTIRDAREEGWLDDPAYEKFQLGTYVGEEVEVGGEVEVEGEVYGTLCFAASRARKRSFSDQERRFVEFLAGQASEHLPRPAGEL